MTYFSTNFLSFFKELAKNNSKAWFDENRKTYEKEVKGPFSFFVGELIKNIQQHEPRVQITPSQAIMRINRDVRFSKDKTPYNTQVSANISVFGKKDKSYPGFYVQLSPNAFSIYGGVYTCDKDRLLVIRRHINSHLKEFKKICDESTFKEHYGLIQGEKHKRIPPEFKELATKEPLIANKQFYYSAELESKLITSDHLLDTVMDYYLAARKVNQFFIEAIE
jgi:uncharacterized protein (TIGR02453 family)